MDRKDDRRLIKAKEAAAILGISPSTLGRWLKAGKIHGTKLGRDWRFSYPYLLKIIEKAGRKPKK